MTRGYWNSIPAEELKTWHALRFNTPAGFGHWDNAIEWCKEYASNKQFLGPYFIDVLTSMWYFEDGQDALMFSLLWGGQ